MRTTTTAARDDVPPLVLQHPHWQTGVGCCWGHVPPAPPPGCPAAVQLHNECALALMVVVVLVLVVLVLVVHVLIPCV